MKVTDSISTHKTLVVLARLLDRLECSSQPVDPGQYRLVVNQLVRELEAAPHDPAFNAVLQAFPEVAEIYENLNYQHAGLCRHTLEASLAAESAARAAIEAARWVRSQPF